MANSAVAAGFAGEGIRGQIVAASVDIFKQEGETKRPRVNGMNDAAIPVMTIQTLKRAIMLWTRILEMRFTCDIATV
jgi:hypothetical protein